MPNVLNRLHTTVFVLGILTVFVGSADAYEKGKNDAGCPVCVIAEMGLGADVCPRVQSVLSEQKFTERARVRPRIEKNS